MRLSIDVGGTFTDLVLVDEAGSRTLVDKVPSTPGSGDAVMTGIERIAEAADIRPEALDIVFHGFTIATNAWLTRSGARVVALVTEGFRDIFALGSQRRPATYDLTAQKPEPLVPRYHVLEVSERMDAFGSVIAPLTADTVDALADAVAALKPESVAISLLFSWANPAHELALSKALARRLPEVPVYLSSEVNPQIIEYPRANTTAAAAYVGPPVAAYTQSLEADLQAAGVTAPLRYMRSDGGAATGRAARDNPANMLLSGPAGGLVGALAHAPALGVANLVTFDMGGTSADFSVIRDGDAARVRDREFDGLPLRVPTLEIKAISAGGGSIGWVDRGGALRVGPASAGAVPGPACYGNGGDRPTLTDAALKLGFIDGAHFAGGQLTLNPRLAETAVREQVAVPLGLDNDDAALGMFAVATANMAQAIRELSTERGDDLSEFALLSFGGAGGLFAPFLLRELGLAEAIMPRHPGVFAALGLHFADLRHQMQRPFAVGVERLVGADLTERLKELRGALDAALEADGVAAAERTFEFSADMRYAGQHHQIEVALPAGASEDADFRERLGEQFHTLHERRYGYCHRGSPAELTSVHGVGIGRLQKPAMHAPDSEPATAAEGMSRRVPLGVDSAWVDAAVLHRDQLNVGSTIAGPAIIEQDDSTSLVLSGQAARVDELGFVRIHETDAEGISR
ncbi:MAG: hydantoinase/oxoprolinase family protein [Pseudomonadota bacterium]